jgi:preprotein translocase subunit SecA
VKGLSKSISVARINALESEFSAYTNFELQSKTTELKTRLLKQGKSSLLIEEAFALARESSKRVLGLRHFDVQLLGGLVINEDKIAEMKTGEGKTLVSILPAFFNALYEQGVQIITVNEYLAARDSQFTAPVHRLLGLNVGLVTESMGPLEKQASYNCDITYVTNSELGFDYLRDNLVQTPGAIVQRSLFYCIIDEIDSILIDDASTPLIISGITRQPDNELKKRYRRATHLANFLDRNKHYTAEERTKSILFTDEGISVVENCLETDTDELYMTANPFWFLLLNAIKAKEFYALNRNYLIDPSSYKIVILDEFTGRALQGRRWSDGLQEAIEAKENLNIDGGTPPLASISYQNLFLLYNRLSGMSGTAQTEKQEFKTIYNLATVTIPTNKPSNRTDYPDFVYIRQVYKWKAVISDCKDMHFLRRPLLVGTKTITTSERIANLLLQINVPYQLLNARPKNFVRESKIIAQAGCKGIVTIATNMAGRGTDIALGGNPQYFATAEIKKTTSFLQLLARNVENPFTQCIDKLPKSIFTL